MVPGSGGISRGRGDAALNLTEPNQPFGDQSFDVKRLTPSEYASLDQSILVGVGLAAPTASGSQGESAGTAATSQSVGASAWKRRIEPRHRRAVSKFFDR